MAADGDRLANVLPPRHFGRLILRAATAEAREGLARPWTRAMARASSAAGLGSFPGEPAGHQGNEWPGQVGFRVLRKSLVVADIASPLHEPAQRSFDLPISGRHSAPSTGVARLLHGLPEAFKDLPFRRLQGWLADPGEERPVQGGQQDCWAHHS